MTQPEEPENLSASDKVTKQLMFLMEQSIAGKIEDIALVVKFDDGKIHVKGNGHLLLELINEQPLSLSLNLMEKIK